MLGQGGYLFLASALSAKFQDKIQVFIHVDHTRCERRSGDGSDSKTFISCFGIGDLNVESSTGFTYSSPGICCSFELCAMLC